jgi:hypothetical protein
MDTAKGLKSISPNVRHSRHVPFTSVLQPAQALRRLRCWAICPAEDDLELEDWMVSGSIDG